MKIRPTVRVLLASVLLVASAAAVPAFAQVRLNLRVAPPPEQVEVVPPLPPGYAWAPGYWGWHGDRYIWVHGRSIYQRQGYRWAPDRWEQRNNMYYRHHGAWERDRNHDGPGRGHGRNNPGRGPDHK